MGWDWDTYFCGCLGVDVKNELIERVARALAQHDYPSCGFDGMHDVGQRGYRAKAHSVLAELAGELGDAKPNTLEREWDYSLHTNPSAQAWAEAFSKMYPTCNVRHDVMIGWFANAMMAMHDYLKGGGPINGDHAQFLQDKAIDEARHG